MAPVSETTVNQNASANTSERTSKQMHSPPTSPRKANATDDFPSLAMTTEDDRRRTMVWNDVTAMKKKPGNKDSISDPFAGMDAFVDYQKEIERLKAMVPKVEPKKRASTRPKSLHSEFPASVKAAATSSRSSWNESPLSRRTTMNKTSSLSTLPSSAQSPPSRNSAISSLESSSCISPTTSPRSASPTMSEQTLKSPMSSLSFAVSPKVEDDNPTQSTSVITEEEKERFLAFVRSWTGGWQGWSDRNDHEIGMEKVPKAGSLWAKQSLWDRRSKPPAVGPFDETSGGMPIHP